MTAPEICTRIVKCLQDVWTDKMLFDFAVKVSDETIQCHRLILAACSDFFKALFRSGMREVTENCVVLQDVSCEVFQIILKTIYTGTNLLTLENIFEVWRAAHQLQIAFMIDQCENFAISSITMDTWESIYTNAKLLDSVKVSLGLQNFMSKNYDKISLSTMFLHLPFNEVADLIKRQDLVVASEDVVLESVLRWVKYVPTDAHSTLNSSSSGINLEIHNTNISQIILADTNQHKIKNNAEEINSEAVVEVDHILETKTELTDECSVLQCKPVTEYSTRQEKLTDLLKLVRRCLLSPAMLSRIYKMETMSENNVLKNIMFDAFYYVQNFRHGQWPTAALHRSCSEYINVGVLEKCNGTFEVVSPIDEKLYNISKCDYLQENIQLVCFNNELFVFCDNSWDEILTMPGQNLLLLSHEQFIYILNKDDKIIYKVNPMKKKTVLETFTDFPENVDVQHAMFFENLILFFCSETHNGIDETAVQKFDISSKVWTRLDNLDGPAEQIISFRNDENNYILQKNGTTHHFWQKHFPDTLNKLDTGDVMLNVLILFQLHFQKHACNHLKVKSRIAK
ncbi:kelch-like protein 38 [Physella acuta]|uniref:kelch-like protein 38 n=1 Tax=Physella acuta TaxID=109671 RepID=UPI0027DE123E|nr:kelch-like protein 38 [Physella acuta]